MDLYLVRHGVTAWNLLGRYQGWSDTELVADGVAQARQTAAFFATRHHRFQAVYSSPLRRAWHTANIIGEWVGLAPVPVDDLREMYGGAVEGLTQPEWQSRYPPELAARWSDPADLDFGWPGGESRRAMRDRCRRAIETLTAQHTAEDQVIVVTHGGVIKAYLALVLPDSPELELREPMNCSITRVHLGHPAPGAPAVVTCVPVVNAVDHLHDLQETAPIAHPKHLIL